MARRERPVATAQNEAAIIGNQKVSGLGVRFQDAGKLIHNQTKRKCVRATFSSIQAESSGKPSGVEKTETGRTVSAVYFRTAPLNERLLYKTIFLEKTIT
jgi:hypothetical protein